jgi:hypothetical protein
MQIKNHFFEKKYKKEMLIFAVGINYKVHEINKQIKNE